MITPKYKKIAAIILSISIITILIAVVVYFLLQNEIRGMVTTNGHYCADIGVSILKKGGNAVDASIASLFCEGIAMPQSMGLGGGFLMTIYDAKTKKTEVLNAREIAPRASTTDMFHGNQNISQRGGLSIAVPGELRGYWYAYQKYGGQIEWKELVQPTIDLCKNGILVTEYVADILKQKFDLIRSDPGLRSAYIDPATNQTYKAGQYVKRLRLAKTLEIIAEEGGDALHNGSLTEKLVEDIQNSGGIITADDLRDYKPKWMDPIKVDLPFNQVLYTTPLPGSGVILAFILNILNDFLDYSQFYTIKNIQRIIESFKYGYGRRTELGDPDFVDIQNLLNNLTSPEYAAHIRSQITDNQTYNDATHYGAKFQLIEDHGTAHICVLDGDGNAVAATSTINLYFGSGIMSLNTGVILNDEMDDFSSPNIISNFDIPPSVANFISPGKQPLSSMCPSIIVRNDGNVALIVGAAGGTKITTSVALALMKHLWFDYNINDAVQDKRFHHQLFPMHVEVERDFQSEEPNILKAIKDIGHQIEFTSADGFSAITAISNKDNAIEGSTDKRRPGGDIARLN